ncbi:MAG TPA: DUF3459 domain-containing protein, partial [Gemmataceae bacterium]|nr:DUF3459 domain-containing protein [Gemmataceae bacterium]
LFSSRPDKLRAQTAWLLLGPGTPFIYYGNEIAQPQGSERGDVKHRKPLDWAAVKRQRDDETSVWRWHQQLIRLRAQYPSLRRGKAQLLSTSAGDRVLTLWRTHGDDTTITLFNAQDAPLESLKVALPAPASRRRFVLGSGPAQGPDSSALEAGSFAPYETKLVSLRP